jgi:hypothetical protein
MRRIKLPFGLKGDSLVHISQVENGLDCDCVCPHRKERFIAKKGRIVAPHFAHGTGAECASALETALHLAAKEILTERHEIRLPAVTVDGQPTMVISPERMFVLDDVRAESRTGSVVPDILASCSDRHLMIEICVTHAVDETKLKKIRDLRISATEIDLSGACRDYSPELLSKAVIEETANKKWLFNVNADYWGQRFLQTTEKRGTIQRGFAIHIDYCPLEKRSWKGKPYANVVDDCSCCEFIAGVGEDNEYIICGGEHKITTFDQLQAYYGRKEP